jgi:hypothetical protein
MKRIILPFLALLFFAQCRTSRNISKPGADGRTVLAGITKEGFIDCFENGLSASGLPVWCEASAILYDGRHLLLANDKDMPDNRSSVFYWGLKKGVPDTSTQVNYVTNAVFKTAKKFEDFAATPDGKFIFLSTAFDRVKPGTSEWNGYNSIYYWQTGNENQPTVLNTNGTDSTSVFLREKFSAALKSPEFPQGMPYFKIEGLAATDNELYFGVREEGLKFDSFQYKIKILSLSFSVNNGTIQLGDSLKVITDFIAASSDTSFKQPMGISSIEFDRYNNRFLILTSYEKAENLGGYLWTASRSDLENNKLNPVRDQAGRPISFTHKPEDIAVISKKKVIIIHDDDRVKTTVSGAERQPNQAAYSIVEFR